MVALLAVTMMLTWALAVPVLSVQAAVERQAVQNDEGGGGTRQIVRVYVATKLYKQKTGEAYYDFVLYNNTAQVLGTHGSRVNVMMTSGPLSGYAGWIKNTDLY